MRNLHIRMSGKFELWVLAAAVAMCSIGTAVVSIYVLTESGRRCNDINQANKGNRQAWDYVEESVKARWEKNPPSMEQQAITIAFFDHIQALLAPVKC